MKGEWAGYDTPFVVGEGSVSVSVKTIPGLKYALQRTDSLRRAEGASSDQQWGEVKSVIATGTSVTLTDDNPPAAKAFYRVGVFAP